MSGRNGVRVRWVTSRELSITQKVAPELTSATNHEKNVRLLVIRVYNVTVTYAIEKKTLALARVFKLYEIIRSNTSIG